MSIISQTIQATYFIVAPGFNMVVNSTEFNLKTFTIMIAEELRHAGFFIFETEDPNGGKTTATLIGENVTHFIVMDKKGFENYKYEQARTQAAQGGRIIS